MQGEAACRAGEPSGQGEEPSPKGIGGRDLLAQTDPRRPAGQVVGHHLYRQQAPLAAKRPDGMWFRPTPYLRSSNGVLDLGVAAVVGLQFQGLSVPVGDEAVIAVGGEEGQLGTGRRLHPPDDEPYRCGAGLSPEGGVGGLRHIGGAVHPVGDRRPVCIGNRLDQVPQAFVLADGDGEADIHLTTGGDESVGVEAAVGPRRKLPAGPGTANPAHRFTQEVAAPRAVLARPSRSRDISTSPVPAAMANSGDSPACRYSRGGVRPPWPVRRSRRWWSPGQWSGAVAGSCPGLPGPGQQLAAHPVELTDVAPPEAAQEGTQGGWRLDRAAQGAGRPPVRNTSASSMQSPPASAEATSVIILSPAFARPRGIAQVEALLDEFGQAEMPGQGGRKEQPGIGHQAVVVKDDANTVGVVA